MAGCVCTVQGLSCDALSYEAMFVDVCRRKPAAVLCQNCVTCPPKPRSNTVVYGDTLMHIDVAGSS